MKTIQGTYFLDGTFSKLDPKLTTAENFDLIKSSIDSVFPLPPDGISVKRKEEDYTDAMEQEVLMEATVEALDDLFKEILLKDVSPEGLEGIFKVSISIWVRGKDLARTRPACVFWTGKKFKNISTEFSILNFWGNIVLTNHLLEQLKCKLPFLTQCS